MLPLKTDQFVPVFIVHWNRPWECIRSVQHFLKQDLPVKVSVVDNASDRENFQILCKNLPSNVETIRLSENRGWGGGLNVLLNQWLSTEQSSFCFISAHDAIPRDNCLCFLLKSMQDDPKIGIICPEYGMAHLPQFSPIRGARLVPIKPRSVGTVEAVDFPHGTLMLLRRQCLKQIGVFDERYFAYGDEYELGLRAWHNKWKVAVLWGAVVVNPGCWTSKPVVSYLLARNSLLLAHTHGGSLSVIVRTILMVANSVLTSIRLRGKGRYIFDLARMIAIRDFYLQRFGPPEYILNMLIRKIPK